MNWKIRRYFDVLRAQNNFSYSDSTRDQNITALIRREFKIKNSFSVTLSFSVSGDIFWLNTEKLRALNDAIFVHIYEAFSLHFIAQFTIGTHHREQNSESNGSSWLIKLAKLWQAFAEFRKFYSRNCSSCILVRSLTNMIFGGWGMEHRRLKTLAPPASWELWKLNLDSFWMHTLSAQWTLNM